MKFKGTMGTQFSGSLAGVTASHNAGGAYLRQRAVPVQPNTGNQATVKALFSDLAADWLATLTQAQRDAWEDYAANTPITNVLGESIVISGRSFFIGNNTMRLRAGLAQVNAGPTVYGLPELTLPTLAADSTPQLEIGYTNTDLWATAVGGGLVIQSSTQQNPTVNFWKGPFVFADTVEGAATPPTSPFTVAAAQLPSGLTTGNAVFARLRATTADGRVSAPVILRAVIASPG